MVCGAFGARCLWELWLWLKRPCPELSVLDMWGRIKGQVNWTKEDQDASDDDTILSRALLRYYAPEIPPWLASAKGADEIMRVSPQAASSYSQSTSQYSLSSALPQSYSRRGSSVDGPRKFERSDSFAAPSASEPQPRAAPKHSASGLVSRLKNTNW